MRRFQAYGSGRLCAGRLRARGAPALLGCALAAACVTSRRPLPEFPQTALRPTTTVRVFDPSGRPVGEPAVLGPQPRLVGRLQPNPWAEAAPARDARRSRQDRAPQAGALEPQDLYQLFGTRIVIHDDGRVTKAYYVDQQTSQVLTNILSLRTGKPPDAKGEPSSFTFKPDAQRPKTLLDTLLGKNEVAVDIIDQFDVEKAAVLGDEKFAKAFPTTKTPIDVSNDLVLVTAKPDGLEAFEQAMDLFYRSVPQILIEAKVIEFSRNDTLDLGVSQVDPDTPTVRTTGKGSFVKSIVSSFGNAAVSASQGGTASEGLLTLGGIHDNLELNAVLDLLQSQAESDIVSQPRIAVRNGGVAIVDTRTRLPYPEARITGQNVTTNIKFLDVGVTLQIRPDVAPGDTVRLQIFASVDAVTGFAETQPIATPQVSSRVARTTVHVPSGKTTVIGGLITKSSFENESKIPVLGDIPLLGFLFRSTSIQTGSSEVVFMITPRIIYGFEGVDADFDYAGG